jgi:topoisomerase-4 subunit B
MAKSATKKKPAKQPDLFDMPRTAKSSARKGPKTSARAKTSARSKSVGRGSSAEAAYTAKHIEVLEGLEPVRRRPGMYIGGTDEKALHHLFAEVIDNAMDEALAGHADWIEVEMETNGFVSVTDNGRGIPVDPHPKFKSKSALEVIMCTLHAGGKFDSKVYETSGGLHGVGVSSRTRCPNAWKSKWRASSSCTAWLSSAGSQKGKLEKTGRAPNGRGTRVRFKPDPEIFGPKAAFKPERVFKMARSKAYLYGGVEIRWHCDKALLKGVEDVPEKATFHFADGLKDYLASNLTGATLVHPDIFTGSAGKTGRHGAVEWAVAWTVDTDGFLNSYCNTIPTPDGGTHESGLRSALLRGLKVHAARVGQEKRATPVTSDDVMTGVGCMLSVFVRGLNSRVKRRIDWPRPKPSASSNRRSRTRSITGWPAIQCRQASCSISSLSAPMNAFADGRKRISRARRPYENCASPASSPIAHHRRRKAPRFSSSKAIAPAAPLNRPATAVRKRCSRYGARF